MPSREALPIGRSIPVDPATIWSVLTGMARGPSLQPGDELVAAEAVYEAPIVVGVPGLSVRSANSRAPAVFTKPVTLNARGAKLLRAVVKPGSGDSYAVGLSAPDCEVAWNEITEFGARGIQIGKGAEGAHVHHNWVHGQLALTGAGVAGIIAGTGRGTTADVMRALIEWNLIEKIRAFQGIEFKSEGNTAQWNTLLDGAEIVCRHGNKNRILANWVENGMIGLAGVNPLAMWNRVFGTTPRRGRSAVAIRAGSLPPGAAPQASEYVPALDAIVAGEGADILDGWVKGEGKSWDNAPKGSRARKFRGEVFKGDKPGGVSLDELAVPGEPMVPQKLSAAMVGPNGDHDPAEPANPPPVEPGPVTPPPVEPPPAPSDKAKLRAARKAMEKARATLKAGFPEDDKAQLRAAMKDAYGTLGKALGIPAKKGGRGID